MSWSDLFLPAGSMTADEQQDNLDRQKRLLAQRLAEREAAGTITAAEADQARAALGTSLSSQDLAAAAGAVQGATELLTDPQQWAKDTAEGAKMAATAAGAATSFSFDIFGTVLGGFLKAIPFWAWLVAGAGVFFYLGGGAVLRRKVAKL